MAAPTATQVLDLARKQLGNVGGATYKAHFKADPAAAWCAYFVCWVLAQHDVEGPRTGWTPSIVAWAKKNGRWKTSGGKPGDLVLFMWAGVSAAGRGTPAVCHTGFLEATNADKSITTLEGNTSATVNGSQYNGNVMARKVRSGAVIVGYVDLQNLYSTPKATTAKTSTTKTTTAKTTTAKTTTAKAPAPILQIGSTGATVGKLQLGLRNAFPAYRTKVAVKPGSLIAVDRVYGKQTAAWVKHFQSRTGLTPTGKVDAATKAKLAKYGIRL